MDKKNLQYFQNTLEKRRLFILDQMGANTQEIEDLHNSEPNDNVDFSTINTSSQIKQTINDNLKQELTEIKSSLEKIKQGTFGICEGCGEEINPERLKVKPHARYCIICRELIEKEKK